MEFLIFLLILLSLYPIGYIAGCLLLLLWDGLAFLLIALGDAAIVLARLAGRLIACSFRLAGRGIVLTARGAASAIIFLFYLADEFLRGAPPEEDATEDEASGEEDLVEVALTLLGLTADYTRAALDAAFKKAMKTAHPDAGGTASAAQAVNAARDLLMRRKGWAG